MKSGPGGDSNESPPVSQLWCLDVHFLAVSFKQKKRLRPSTHLLTTTLSSCTNQYSKLILPNNSNVYVCDIQPFLSMFGLLCYFSVRMKQVM